MLCDYRCACGKVQANVVRNALELSTPIPCECGGMAERVWSGYRVYGHVTKHGETMTARRERKRAGLPAGSYG